MENRKVLDYKDVLLRHSDVRLLEGREWLNDQVLAFYLEYLSHEGLESDVRDDALLLSPSTAFLLLHSSPDMAAEVLAPLKPQERSLVVLPVNDNPHVEVAAGGSHWSLLVHHRPTASLRHYDSSPGAGNAAAARRLAAAVGPALAARGGGGGGTPWRYVRVSCMPSQTNGHDCGLYVLAIARAVCAWQRGLAREQHGQRLPRPEGHGAGGVEEGMGTGGECAATAAAAEEYWRQQEARLGDWLTPGHVASLRGEILALIRGKVAASAARAGGGGGSPAP